MIKIIFKIAKKGSVGSFFITNRSCGSVKIYLPLILFTETTVPVPSHDRSASITDLTCKCVYLCVYVFSQFPEQWTMSGLERKWVLSACAHLCSQVCLKCRVYMPMGASFLGDVPLVEYMYLVITRMPGERYRSRLRSLFHVTKSNKRTEESFSLKVRHFV